MIATFGNAQRSAFAFVGALFFTAVLVAASSPVVIA